MREKKSPIESAEKETAAAAKHLRASDADSAFDHFGSACTPRNREEVEGRGSGGTAGGPPAAAGTGTVPPELDAFFREGGSSNTPSLKTITGGEDWLTLNLYLNHLDFDSLSKRLDQIRESASLELADDVITFGDVTFRASSNGARQGDAQKGSWMRWKLKGDNGFTLLLMNSERSNGIQPNGQIQVPSIPLMQKPIHEIWAKIQYIVDGMGSELEANKISRVDPCVDLADVAIEEFMGPFSNDWIVTKAKRKAAYKDRLPVKEFYFGTKSTGFTIGNSPLLLRVYEKLIESNRSLEKLALLTANRWGHFPENAVRVEFQLRRGALKKYGIDTVEDWFEKRANVCHELTHNWTRIVEGPVDRKHANRAPMHEIWQKTINAFESWTGQKSEDLDLTPLAKLEVDNSRLVNSAIGFLIGYMARAAKQINGEQMFVREAVAAIKDGIKDRDIKTEVFKKQIELGLE